MNTDEIKTYWDNRAKNDPSNATTNDHWLRELEYRCIKKQIENCGFVKPFRLLDLGCGDGKLTRKLAHDFPLAEVRGIDFSPAMVWLAEREQNPTNLHFECGNALELKDSRWDVIVATRLICNLATKELQAQAFQTILSHLSLMGIYIGTENFHSGQDALNAMRTQIGLAPISIQAQNLFLNEVELPTGVLIEDTFSSYYFTTRVIYSKLCQEMSQAPDYNHKIQRFAVDIPKLELNLSPLKLLTFTRNPFRLKSDQF